MGPSGWTWTPLSSRCPEGCELSGEEAGLRLGPRAVVVSWQRPVLASTKPNADGISGPAWGGHLGSSVLTLPGLPEVLATGPSPSDPGSGRLLRLDPGLLMTQQQRQADRTSVRPLTPTAGSRLHMHEDEPWIPAGTGLLVKVTDFLGLPTLGSQRRHVHH